MDKMKPCPFCGGEANYEKRDVKFWTVACKDCGSNVGNWYEKETAKALWNKRLCEKNESNI